MSVFSATLKLLFGEVLRLPMLFRLYFYDVLSQHFVQVPKDGQPILDLIVILWSQSFASHIFAVMFHKWLFEAKIEDSEKLLRFCSALVQGSKNVFWLMMLQEYVWLK